MGLFTADEPDRLNDGLDKPTDFIATFRRLAVSTIETGATLATDLSCLEGPMSLKPRHFASLLIAAAAVAVAPVAAADPVSHGSASTVIDDLKSQGYLVQINWVSGYNTEPLDVCQVTGINIPGDTPASRTTAYVDVSCPNHPDDGGFGFGVGTG